MGIRIQKYKGVKILENGNVEIELIRSDESVTTIVLTMEQATRLLEDLTKTAK